jgi:tetratricopeptide (TPR) repeat protein
MSESDRIWKTKESVKLVLWPSPQDYNEAVQNPQFSFTDAELRGGQPELTPLGLPRPMTGAFASVYRLQCKTRDWAVRCFLHNVADQNFRYEQISNKLKEANLPYTAGFEFIDDGINIRASWFPILKMEWVEGATLISYIEKNLDKPSKFSELNQRFHQMMKDLHAAGIAHGDLQHGNIIIENDQFRLVDYDGMFVSTLSGRGANELGHRNYQHPGRAPGHFGLYLDNFSAWVIHTSLLCLSHDSSLWRRLKGGDECMLFKQSDFTNPTRSRTFYELEHHAAPEVSNAAKVLRGLLSMRPDKIPALDEIDVEKFVQDCELPEIVPEVEQPAPPQPKSRPKPRPTHNWSWPNQLETPSQSTYNRPTQLKTAPLSLAVPIFIWSVVLLCTVGSLALNTYSAVKNQSPSQSTPVSQEDRFPTDEEKEARPRIRSNSNLNSSLNQGHIKFSEKKWEDAAVYYRDHVLQIQKAHPDWKSNPQLKNEIAEAEYHYGFCRVNQKRFGAAIIAHLTAVELYRSIDPIAYAAEIETLHNELGIEFSRIGQYGNAASHLEKALYNSASLRMSEHDQVLIAAELLTAGKYMFTEASAKQVQQQQQALKYMRSALKVLSGNTRAHTDAIADLLTFSKELKNQNKSAESQLIYELLSSRPDRIVKATKKTSK